MGNPVGLLVVGTNEGLFDGLELGVLDGTGEVGVLEGFGDVGIASDLKIVCGIVGEWCFTA